MSKLIVVLLLAATLLLLFFACRGAVERKFLYYPSHRPDDLALAPWIDDGQVLGCTHLVSSPRNIWLFLHGNGGQAGDRAYILPDFSAEDSVYILEYPGYGNRPGVPSARGFDRAARAAYYLLRKAYPHLPVCVATESIGSGPGCHLASLPHPPDKLVLIVPFDRLSAVARDHFPALLVRLMLTDDWDNVRGLAHYQGPVDIFAARDDAVVPPAHAENLAASHPSAKFVLIEGGHNEWATPGRVRIANP